MNNYFFSFITVLFFILFSTKVRCQEEHLTISFSDKKIIDCFKEIELKTNHQFFFLENWDDLQRKVSYTFTEELVEKIIEKIITETNLNYFIFNSQIIITQNNFIYSELNFKLIQESEEESIPTDETPLFFEKIKSNTADLDKEILFIGKQNNNKNKDRYSLEGTITDSKTKKPIPNTIIKVNNIYKTETDLDGKYKIEVKDGLNKIDLDALSYKKRTKTIIIKKDATLNFNLEEDITLLNEVVVQKERNKDVKSINPGVVSFNVEKVKTIPLVLGERDIIKLALALPGVKTASEGTGGINVRGGKEDQNLFLLDNATIYNPTHFFGFFSSFNPYLVSDINIYKGHIPSKYGGRISSVFDIKSKEANEKKFKGEGGIGIVTSNLTFNTPLIKEKSKLIGGLRATYTKWLLRQIDNDQLKKSEANFYDGFIKYEHTINENNHLETFFYKSNDEFNISSDSIYHYTNTALSLRWKHNFNKKNIANFQITNSQYAFDIDYKSINLNSFEYNFKMNEFKFLGENTYFVNEKHKLNFGINNILYNLNPGELTPTDQNSLLIYRKVNDEKGLESALFVNDEYNLNKKLSFNLGLRFSSYLALGPGKQTVYNNNSSTGNVDEIREYKNNELIKNYNGMEYRFGSRYLITESSSIKFAYTTSYQYLHKLTSNTTQSPTDTWKLADLNIKPAFGQQFSIGFFKNFKEDLYEMSLETYYKKTKNFLDFKVGSELILSEAVETDAIQGKGRAYGVELMIKKSEGRLNGWISYTYSRSLIQLNGATPDKIVNNGKYFASNFDKPHDFNTILNYRFTKRYSASMNLVYQTGRPITYPIGSYTYGNAQYTLYSDRNKFRIPDHYRIDIGINIEGNHKIKKPYHSFWNLSVYNLLGRNNPHSVFFVTDNGKIKAYKTSIFAYPIPTLTYNFKF